MFDASGNPTDDADRMIGGCDTFAPGDDYDPMYADAPGGGSYKCGRGPYRDTPCCCDDDGQFVGPGCRHCNPPDHEGKPYGFGIERFDSPEWQEARRHFNRVRSLVFGLPATAHPVMDYGHWLAAWAVKAGWSERRQRHSDIVWDRLCEECETHTEAVEKYEAWAKRAVAVKYRDQR